jgi:hypothetical protein
MAYFRVRRFTGRDSVKLGLIEARDERAALLALREADPARAETESYWLIAPRGGFGSLDEAIADAQGRPAEPFDAADQVVRTAAEIALS